jgi:hypothetical protein
MPKHKPINETSTFSYFKKGEKYFPEVTENQGFRLLKMVIPARAVMKHSKSTTDTAAIA